jgi:hypothetical protein
MNQLIKEYVSATPMLDFEDESIQSLISEKHWRQLSQYDAIGSIYTYVRDEILFVLMSTHSDPFHVHHNGTTQCAA